MALGMLCEYTALHQGLFIVEAVSKPHFLLARSLSQAPPFPPVYPLQYPPTSEFMTQHGWKVGRFSVRSHLDQLSILQMGGLGSSNRKDLLTQGKQQDKQRIASKGYPLTSTSWAFTVSSEA